MGQLGKRTGVYTPQMYHGLLVIVTDCVLLWCPKYPKKFVQPCARIHISRSAPHLCWAWAIRAEPHKMNLCKLCQNRAHFPTFHALDFQTVIDLCGLCAQLHDFLRLFLLPISKDKEKRIYRRSYAAVARVSERYAPPSCTSARLLSTLSGLGVWGKGRRKLCAQIRTRPIGLGRK